MKVFNLLFLIIFISFFSSCLTQDKIIKLKENSEECIVTKETGFLSTKVTVKNDTAYFRDTIFNSSIVKIKSNGNIVSTSIISSKVAKFKNNKLI